VRWCGSFWRVRARMPRHLLPYEPIDYGYRNYLSESEGFGASSFSFGIVWVH